MRIRRREIAREIFEVDSIPRGAAVKLLPPENATNHEAKFLGKTPLIINRAEYGKSRLMVEMNMAEYLKEVEPLPELQEWIKRFKSDQYFSAGSYSSITDEYFTFETSHSQQTSSASGGLISIGPVYDLAEMGPDSRICTLFIPRGTKREAFFPLMPPAGTYPAIAGTWLEKLRNHYHLTEAQAACATACMTRCGKYEVTVPDPYVKDKGKEFDFTVQRDGTVSIMNMSLGMLIPGLNDKP